MLKDSSWVPGHFQVMKGSLNCADQVYMKEDGFCNEEKDAHRKRKATKKDAVKAHECLSTPQWTTEESNLIAVGNIYQVYMHLGRKTEKN